MKRMRFDGVTPWRVTSLSCVVVPDHKRIRLGTLRQILNEAGVTLEQLLELR
jgi:hypothetical protein